MIKKKSKNVKKVETVPVVDINTSPEPEDNTPAPTPPERNPNSAYVGTDMDAAFNPDKFDNSLVADEEDDQEIRRKEAVEANDKEVEALKTAERIKTDLTGNLIVKLQTAGVSMKLIKEVIADSKLEQANTLGDISDCLTTIMLQAIAKKNSTKEFDGGDRKYMPAYSSPFGKRKNELLDKPRWKCPADGCGNEDYVIIQKNGQFTCAACGSVYNDITAMKIGTVNEEKAKAENTTEKE